MTIEKKIKNIVTRIQYYCESANEVILDSYECKTSNVIAIKMLENIIEMLCDESVHLNNILEERLSKYDCIVSNKKREKELIKLITKQIDFMDETIESIEYKGKDSIIH